MSYHKSLASKGVAQDETREKPQLLTSQQVADILFISVRTLWRMVEQKKFPQPIRYNRKIVRWRRSDIQRFIDTGEIGGDK